MSARTLSQLILLAALGSNAHALDVDTPTYDEYGGYTALQGDATGWFHTEIIDGRHWLVTPDGHGFYFTGVEYIQITDDTQAAFEDEFCDGMDCDTYRELSCDGDPCEMDAWAASTIQSLRSNGLTAIGSNHFDTHHVWLRSLLSAEDRMPYMVNLAGAVCEPDADAPREGGPEIENLAECLFPNGYNMSHADGLTRWPDIFRDDIAEQLATRVDGVVSASPRA